MAASDVDALFAETERSLQELRRIAAGDLAEKRAFKEFIRTRNTFHEQLSSLNEMLYRQKDALLVPELLEEDEDGDTLDIARLDVALTDIRLPEGEELIDAVVAALETHQNRFSVVSVFLG